MSEEIYCCGKCGFKCVISQLSKSEGYCPKCGNGRADLVEKHKPQNWVKRGG